MSNLAFTIIAKTFVFAKTWDVFNKHSFKPTLMCTIIIIERTLPAFPVSQTCRERWMEFADIIRISRVDNVRLRRPAEPHAEVMPETPPFSGNV